MPRAVLFWKYPRTQIPGTSRCHPQPTSMLIVLPTLGEKGKKNSVLGLFWGNEEDLRGTKQQKLQQISVHFLGVIFTFKLG